jgi:HSP20 family protein
MQGYLWNPWSVFDELERAVLDAGRSSEWPVFDIEDTDDETILTADLPGLTENDIEVTVTAPLLTVRGERTPGEGRYLRRQRFHGSFVRQFRLGEHHDPDGVHANLNNGVLTIRLAKVAQARPRRIKLTTGVIDRVKGLLTGDKDKQRAA